MWEHFASIKLFLRKLSIKIDQIHCEGGFINLAFVFPHVKSPRVLTNFVITSKGVNPHNLGVHQGEASSQAKSHVSLKNNVALEHQVDDLGVISHHQSWADSTGPDDDVEEEIGQGDDEACSFFPPDYVDLVILVNLWDAEENPGGEWSAHCHR